MPRKLTLRETYVAIDRADISASTGNPQDAQLARVILWLVEDMFDPRLMELPLYDSLSRDYRKVKAKINQVLQIQEEIEDIKRRAGLL
jgi:hypothetical protein